MNITFVNKQKENLNKLLLTDSIDFLVQETALDKDFLTKRIASTKDEVINLVTPTGSTCIVFTGKKSTENQRLEYNRRLAAQVIPFVKKEKLKEISLISDANKEDQLAFVEGLLLASYEFTKYKTKKEPIDLALNTDLSTVELNEVQTICDSNAVAKTLVNEPLSFLNAVQYSEEMQRLSKEYGFNVEVLEKKQIEALKMGGLLGVNQGSDAPPTFNILEWKSPGAKNTKPIVLVGKGVVYDTGGYDLKTDGHMSNMKMDMGGSAAVVGTLCAISKNKVPVHVIGLIPATDNKIGPNGFVTDDVLHMHDGTTVEVKNTDAEGRLILADALAYAKKYKPELVIDLATLTGAAMRVTGHYGTAMMGTASDTVKEKLTKAGNCVHERLIEFPFWEEFEDDIKSDIADIKNLGGPAGGASTAGKFLQHFTDYPWIHLDIAGPAFLSKAYHYSQPGGTGVGVRLLYDFLNNHNN